MSILHKNFIIAVFFVTLASSTALASNTDNSDTVSQDSQTEYKRIAPLDDLFNNTDTEAHNKEEVKNKQKKQWSKSAVKKQAESQEADSESKEMQEPVKDTTPLDKQENQQEKTNDVQKSDTTIIQNGNWIVKEDTTLNADNSDTYTVKKGDILSLILKDRLTKKYNKKIPRPIVYEYLDLVVTENSIERPGDIESGMVLSLPKLPAKFSSFKRVLRE